MASSQVGTAVSSSDDMIREILARLEDAADLFRCAMTCKRWCSIVAKASFLRRRLWPGHTSTFLSGFFVWKEVDLKIDTTFIPTPRSVLGSKHRPLKSFFSGAARRPLRHAMPLASRHGLLLVRLDSPDSPDDTVHLAVCNLLVGACHKLPPLDCDWKFGKSGYAILTGLDCSSDAKKQPSAPPQSYSAFFKVLIIGNDTERRPHSLHTFTSGEARWRRPSKFPFAAEGKSDCEACEPLRNARAVVRRGTAHWLVRYFAETCRASSWHTIDVDAETCRASLTKIETPIGHEKIHGYDEAHLTIAADGKLSLFHMRKRGYQLEVWIRQEDGGGGGPSSRWLCAPDVELNPPSRKSLLILGDRGDMVLVKDIHGNVYTADLETGEMEEVTSFDRITRRQIVPLEMDWPTFFVSRLGNR